MFKEIKNSLKDNGIQFSETGDLMVVEPILSQVMEDAGADVHDMDTIDSSKVIQLASEIGLSNLGGFGDLAGAGADEFLFHMSVVDIEDYERQVRLGNKKENAILQGLIDLADSYL